MLFLPLPLSPFSHFTSSCYHSALPAFDQTIEPLVSGLPDAEGARLFFERLQIEHLSAAKKLARDAGLLSDALALAAWSPLLSTTLAQNPDYIAWLARERVQTRVRTREELTESLARFALVNSQLEAQVLLSRFRRRELLRIYLHDIRSTSTLVEITEELSNLADAILEHALNLARQDLDNRYGQPECMDEKGRTATASFSIIALGKLGSLELNYASDIDLLFLYSDEGKTSGAGERGAVTNREYFNKLAETVARIVGGQSGEGAAYRVDLRLRPFGRDGALATSLEEAVCYYRETAQAWELQSLIRSRAAAGRSSLYARFAGRVRNSIYARDVTVTHALSNVRLAKQKIDRQHAHDAGGFNVKLGRGGIREIEFIAQALQLAFGGLDPWLRAPHTLISLGRLADRQLIRERERTELTDAYIFLRKLEHRLQMEHGLQTHSVPDDEQQRTIVARRMDFAGTNALQKFNRALQRHTASVCAAFDRVFKESEEVAGVDIDAASGNPTRAQTESTADAETSITLGVAAKLAPHIVERETGTPFMKIDELAAHLREQASRSLNAHRAMTLLSRIASSLEKGTETKLLTPAHLDALVSLCGASEYLGEMVASNPMLIYALPLEGEKISECSYRELLLEAVELKQNNGFGAEIGALRRSWASLLFETGALDISGAISMYEANARQTTLAAASLDAGCLIASRELARRYGEDKDRAHVAILGLGRLGGRGMDYGSDLDIVLVYDDSAPSPVSHLAHAESYARFSESLVAALSSITRDGYLYRVDLRLRPDGRNGATCLGASAFIDYLRMRAVEWEWLAYVKLRAAAGRIEFGKRVEREARKIVHEAASASNAETLRLETRRVRERLEYERVGRRKQRTTDIKYGAGGMLDVYFATRYLQLRDRVPDEDDDRSTRGVLDRLYEAGSIETEDYAAMRDGYALLRSLDHHLRLIVGRSTKLPATDHPALRDLARKLNYASANHLTEDLSAHMKKIRAAYDHITKG